MMQIPIIILNYNSAADTRKCIATLRAQQGVELEYVVVDNMSTAPGEQQALDALAAEPGVTLLRADANRGYNAGNNIGMRYAASRGYRYALVANPDMEFDDPAYVLTMATAMDERPQVAVCGTDIVGPESKHQNPMLRDGGWRSCFAWIPSLLRGNKTQRADTYDFIGDYRTTHLCSKLSGCCLMVRLDYMERTGWFDEGVFLYCEESILSRRVERDSMAMLYLADTSAIHRHVNSEKGDPRPRFRTWTASRIYYERHYNWEGLLPHLAKAASMHTYSLLLRLHATLRLARRRNA